MNSFFKSTLLVLLGTIIGFYLSDGFTSLKKKELVKPISMLDENSLISDNCDLSPAVKNLKFKKSDTEIKKPRVLKAKNKRMLVDLKEKFIAAQSADDLNMEFEVLDQMRSLDENSKEYNESLARHHVRQRDWEKAYEVTSACLSKHPGSHSCNVDMSSIALQIKDKKEQENVIRACLEYFPSDSQCLNMLAINKMNSGKHLEAVKIYKSLIKTNGDHGVRFADWHLLWQLGVALEGVGKKNEAKVYFDRACILSHEPSCLKMKLL